MLPLAGLLILIGSSFSHPTGGEANSLVVKLSSPANVVVEYGQDMAASSVQHPLFLRIQDPVDPTNTLVCKYLQHDYVVFFVTPMTLPMFIQTPVSRTGRLYKELDVTDHAMPMIAFLKKENVIEIPSFYKRINLKSTNAADPWELGAYALAPPGSELSEYPEEILAAPPPFFPSLCVSPDKPKPFPVLFAPSTQAAMIPSLASFTVGDLTPAVVPSVHVVPAAAPPPPMAARVPLAPSVDHLHDSSAPGLVPAVMSSVLVDPANSPPPRIAPPAPTTVMDPVAVAPPVSSAAP